MNKLIKNVSITFFLTLASAPLLAQSNLPPCEGEEFSKWNNCYGTVTFDKGGNYSGEFKNGKFNGMGTFKPGNGDVYVGQYKNNQEDGQGTYTFASGLKYVGQFKKGERSGYGVASSPDGSKYEGQFLNGLFSGQGKFTYQDGSVYEGQFLNGLFNGQGTLIDVDGSSYVGQWKNDKRHGQGIRTIKSGGSYSGQWKDGSMEGRGTITYENGSKQTGVWADGKLIKDESPKPPPMKILTLSCPSDAGDMKGIEFQYEISIENKSIFAVRGTQPSNILITPTVIAFKQGEGAVSINRVTGKFSIVFSGNVMASGTCQSISQAKPKF